MFIYEITGHKFPTMLRYNNTKNYAYRNEPVEFNIV